MEDWRIDIYVDFLPQATLLDKKAYINKKKPLKAVILKMRPSKFILVSQNILHRRWE